MTRAPAPKTKAGATERQLCTLCNRPITPADLAFLHRKRPAHAHCAEAANRVYVMASDKTAPGFWKGWAHSDRATLLEDAPQPGPMKLGYARVSTKEQNLDMQLAALEAAGCARTFTDKVSGTAGPEDRPGLAALLSHLRPGDQVLVWKLDRFARSLPLTLDLISRVRDRGATFVSIAPEEGLFNTGGPQGELVFHIMAALAQYEREIIHRRTVAGIEHAKASGVRFGRPPKLSERDRQMVRNAITSGSMSQAEAARVFKVSKPTIARIVATPAPPPRLPAAAEESRELVTVGSP